MVLYGCPVKLQRQMDENDGVPHYWLYPTLPLSLFYYARKTHSTGLSAIRVASDKKKKKKEQILVNKFALDRERADENRLSRNKRRHSRRRASTSSLLALSLPRSLSHTHIHIRARARAREHTATCCSAVFAYPYPA